MTVPEIVAEKKPWSEPCLVVLEFGNTATKLNQRASEYFRSGISYNPS